MTGVGGLSRLTGAQSRTISPENRTGAKGAAAQDTDGVAAAAARDLGPGWKISPFVYIEPAPPWTWPTSTGPGVIRQIWLTPAGPPWRQLILRVYWDDQAQPSVECPLGDFFASGWGGLAWSGHAQISSLPVCVNPGSALNSFWEMPFRGRCRMTMREPVGRAGPDLLPDQLRAGRGPGRRRLLPRPVPPQQPAGLRDRARHPGPGEPGAVTTSAPTWPGVPTATAGGARAR